MTGAGTGMGAAIARMLAQRGAGVALVGIDPDPLDRVASEITGAGGSAIAWPADVTNPGAVRSAVAAAVERFGELNLAVNCAGIAGPAASSADLEIEGWQSVVETNMSSLFYCVKYELEALLSCGGGAIVNISSVFADRGQPMRPAYSAAKAGIRGLTRSTAVDYAAAGIRINELQPGVIDTPMLDTDREHTEAFSAYIPARRIGRPEEIASSVCFLLSDEASYINGAHLAVDGGFLA